MNLTEGQRARVEAASQTLHDIGPIADAGDIPGSALGVLTAADERLRELLFEIRSKAHDNEMMFRNGTASIYREVERKLQALVMPEKKYLFEREKGLENEAD
jgi:hypothetical protein